MPDWRRAHCGNSCALLPSSLSGATEMRLSPDGPAESPCKPLRAVSPQPMLQLRALAGGFAPLRSCEGKADDGFDSCRRPPGSEHIPNIQCAKRGKLQQSPARQRRRCAGKSLQELAAVCFPWTLSLASHARGRWFETSRAHRTKYLLVRLFRDALELRSRTRTKAEKRLSARFCPSRRPSCPETDLVARVPGSLRARETS